MRKDIDYIDCDGEGLIYDEDWITPSYSKGYSRLRLTDSVGVYYRTEGHYLRFDVVLSFDYLGARSPRTLPILFYDYIDMIGIWEKQFEDSE